MRAGPNPEERALGPALTRGWTPRGCISTNEGHVQEGTKGQKTMSRLTIGKRRFEWLGETCQSPEQASLRPGERMCTERDWLWVLACKVDPNPGLFRMVWRNGNKLGTRSGVTGCNPGVFQIGGVRKR